VCCSGEIVPQWIFRYTCGSIATDELIKVLQSSQGFAVDMTVEKRLPVLFLDGRHYSKSLTAD